MLLISYFFVWSGVAKDVVNPPLFCQNHAKAESIPQREKPKSKLHVYNNKFDVVIIIKDSRYRVLSPLVFGRVLLLTAKNMEV